jgi:alpha-1,6-mannosyltransferase
VHLRLGDAAAHGARASVADVLAAADLYVSPSPVETFGLAPLEALASGTPVLSADRGAVPELVRRSGAGALYRAGEADDLADHAIAMLRDGIAAAGDAARSYAERNHAWPVVFDRLFEAYRGVARS